MWRYRRCNPVTASPGTAPRRPPSPIPAPTPSSQRKLGSPRSGRNTRQQAYPSFRWGDAWCEVDAGSECRRLARIRIRIPVRIRFAADEQLPTSRISPRQSCHGKPRHTAARRFSPSRRLSYITPICQRRIMIQAVLPHRGVERRRPDLSADRATPEAAPINQNDRTSQRNHDASKPPRRPRETPQKMLRERLYFLYFTFSA